MSGNKYELVNAAYTPEIADATRGGLFFKIIFKQDGKGLSKRDLGDSIVKNFITGTGAGWGGKAPGLARGEIRELVIASNVDLTNDGAKRVVTSIMEARKIRDNAATDSATKDLMSRILELYQRVYVIQQTKAGAGAAVAAEAVNVTTNVVGVINLEVANTTAGDPAAAVAADVGKVGVKLKPGVTVAAGAAAAAVALKTDARLHRGFINFTGVAEGTETGEDLSTEAAIVGGNAGTSSWNEYKF